jgi:hypothetical protein
MTILVSVVTAKARLRRAKARSTRFQCPARITG